MATDTMGRLTHGGVVRTSGTAAAQPRWMTWTGRVLSAIPIFMLSMSAVMKLMRGPQVIEGFTGKFGYPEGTLLAIGVLELSVAIVYAIPRTAVLGAILVAAYLGAATATHVRVSDPFVLPILLGVVAWLGLYFREPRLRALVPLRRPE